MGYGMKLVKITHADIGCQGSIALPIDSPKADSFTDRQVNELFQG